MKRIGIVTFFQSYNYGVWFQAYATQAFLRGRGYDAQIVNYSNLHDDEKLKMAFKGKYLQPIITQYFIDNKSEIWLLFLIAHSKR